MLRRRNSRQLNLFRPQTSLLSFAQSLFSYFLTKCTLLYTLLVRAVLFVLRTWGRIKFQIIRKLVWGGGRLGKPVSHVGVVAMSLTIFVVASSFGGSGVVRGQTISPTAIDALSAPVSTETKLPDDRPRDEVFVYEVQSGDTLSSIGEKFQISVDTIRYANDLNDVDTLSVGQKLTILPVSGVRHEVKAGDTVKSIAKKYNVSPQAIVDFNYLNEPFALKVGDKLVVPNASIPQPVPAAPTYAASSGVQRPYRGVVTPGTGIFRWPTNERYITQYFSYWHPAIDIAKYSPIYAADSGTVVTAGWSPWGYGNLVEIDHGNGYRTGYAHMSRIDVSVGQHVGKGQVLGMMGATGRAFGVHLHFMVKQGGRFINPLSVL
jgi:murein DD-endopeptidase MepM/ murein hydrolase activator NlpD